MSWRASQKARLRQLLFDTALDLFRDQGYEGTTIEQITARAGVAKGTFFNYFASKDLVLAEWHRGVTFDALGEAETGDFASCWEAISSLLDNLAARATTDSDLHQMTARHVVSSDVLSAEEQSLDASLLAFFRHHIATGKSSGELDAALDDELFAAMILTMLTGTGHEWVVARQDFDLGQAMRRRAAFLFRAARPA